MRPALWLVLILSIFISSSCFSGNSSENKKKGDDPLVGGLDGAPPGEEGEEGKDPGGELSQDDKKTPAARAVKSFLTHLKKGEKSKALQYFSFNSRKDIKIDRLPYVNEFHILSTKKGRRTLVQTVVSVTYKDESNRRLRMAWITVKEDGDWRILGVKVKGFTCLFPDYDKGQYEARAFYIIQKLKDYENAYRFKNKGQFTDLETLVEKTNLPQKLKDGNFKGYTFTITSSTNKITIRALPNVIIPTHKAFYIDETGVGRYTGDGSLPDGSDNPVILQKSKKKKK